MSATIIESPLFLDFTNNAIKFRLSGTPTAVIGNKAVSKYKISTFPRANYNITVKYGTKQFLFYIRNTTTAQNEPYEIYLYSTTAQKKAELIKKIAQNYYIEKDYSVTVSDTLEITFSARQNGGEDVVLQTNDSAANITLLSQTTGIAKTEKAGYKLFAKLEVTRLTAGSGTVQTPEILLHLDTNNKASLPLTLLRSYFSGVDTPMMSQKFAAYLLKYVMIKYRLVYSDYFDGLVQVLKYSEEKYLLNGKISEQSRGHSIPDWSCPMGEGKNLYAFERPRSYGSSSGLTLKSYTDCPQYAYFMFFNNKVPNNTTSQLQFSINIRNEDGSTKSGINPGTLTLTNYSIVRVPLSVKALSLTNHSTQILTYTVRAYHLSKTTEVWTRTFLMQEKPFFAKEFLLQNKYGVLESFFVENEMIEKTVDGEQVIYDNKTEIDVQDISTTFTARTGNKSEFEMKLLGEALENKHHYKIVNNTLLPITILPDTLTIFDEGEELQSAEFQYVFKISEKTRYESYSEYIEIEDWIRMEAIWDETGGKVWHDPSIFQEESVATPIILEKS